MRFRRLEKTVTQWGYFIVARLIVIWRARTCARFSQASIQSLITDALSGRFDIVLAEAMDRLSRDQEDIAGLFKRFAFANVKMVTLSEGDVTHLHVGLKGTMNALLEGSRMGNPAAAIPTAMMW